MPRRLEAVGRVGMRLLPYALCAALAVGASEASILLARRFLGFRLAFVGPDIAWMAPLAYALVFAGVLALCLLPGLISPGFPIARCFFFATGLVGVAGVLRTLPSLHIHPLSVILLASAVGYQLSRTGPPWLDGRWLRRVAGLAATVVLLTIGTRVLYRGGMVRDAVGRPVAGRPNILLIVWDTVRELDVSLYGYAPPTTPNLERWAARGVVFDRAFATSSWTLPSHASLFTGRFPHELSVDFEVPLDATFPTLAQVLRRQGYRTAGFVANPYYASQETGLARGFDLWENYRVSPEELLLSAGVVQWLLGGRSAQVFRRHNLKRAPEITDAFLAWAHARDHRPYFAFLNYFDAHMPYYAPPEQLKRFAAFSGKASRYDAAIASLDVELGRLLSALEARGELEHTIVVVTSDHGEQFGDHGLVDHANSLYRQVLQVPLVLIAPGRVPAGMWVRFPVSLRNVPSTLLELAGLHGDPLPGESHTRFWQGAPADSQDQPVLSELTPSPRGLQNQRNAHGEIRSLLLGPYHYIQGADGSAELFDLRTDPEENRNLNGGPVLPETVLIRHRMQAFDFAFPRKAARPAVSN